MKAFLNKKGFSLVELMVVVAIIGILASVAIPRFARFQYKARTAEAKTDLATAYTLGSAWAADRSDDFTGMTAAAIGFAPASTRFTWTYLGLGLGTMTINASNATHCGAALGSNWQVNQMGQVVNNPAFGATCESL